MSFLGAAAAELKRLEKESSSEEEYEYYDFNKEIEDPSYRKIYTSKEGENVYVLEGQQLLKIFNSTNFNDLGSLRYLYQYIVKNGAIDKLKEMGLREGDTIKIFDYEFEYYDEY